MNNRGLAALSEAGMTPTNLTIVDKSLVSAHVLARLNEVPTALGEDLRAAQLWSGRKTAVIGTTSSHLFWDRGARRWIKAGVLKQGAQPAVVLARSIAELAGQAWWLLEPKQRPERR